MRVFGEYPVALQSVALCLALHEDRGLTVEGQPIGARLLLCNVAVNGECLVNGCVRFARDGLDAIGMTLAQPSPDLLMGHAHQRGEVAHAARAGEREG